jgi:hypothetical protein
MRNIKFNYLYRDGANYKSWGGVIFSNPDDLALNEIEGQLRNSFVSEEFFIAHQISIPEKFLFATGKFTKYDHCFHTFDCVQICQENTTDVLKRSISDFLREVVVISSKGWKTFDILERA